MAQPLVIETQALTVGVDRPVLKDVNLNLPMGQWWTLLGPNGCGKTTLLDTLSGRLPPLAGQIGIAGHNLQRSPLAAKQRLGYAVPPDRLPDRLTGRECLNVFNQAHGMVGDGEAVQALVETWGFAKDLQQFIDRMSLGMRQKVGLLLAFAGRPDLLLLDESLNGLDPASALALKQRLRRGVERGAFSVLMATHSMDVVSQYADRALVCDQGQLALQLSREDMKQAKVPLDQFIAQALNR
ncbi:MAG: ABC transporter ATP-binding protein [Pseudomonadota bacterium]